MADAFFLGPDGRLVHFGEVTELRLQTNARELEHCTSCGAALLPGDEAWENILSGTPQAPKCQRCAVL
jgi:hypothetical protein